MAGHAYACGECGPRVPLAEVTVAEAVGARGGEGQGVLHVGRAADVHGEDAGADPVVEGQHVRGTCAGAGTAGSGGTPGGDALRAGLVGCQHLHRASGFRHVLLGERVVGAVAVRGEQVGREDLVEAADRRDGAGASGSPDASVMVTVSVYPVTISACVWVVAMFGIAVLPAVSVRLLARSFAAVPWRRDWRSGHRCPPRAGRR